MFCCKRVPYIITTATAVGPESDHTIKPQITKSLKRKKIMDFSIGKKEAKEKKKKLHLDPR